MWFVSFQKNWNKKSHPIFFAHNVWPLNVCQSIILAAAAVVVFSFALFTHEALWAKMDFKLWNLMINSMLIGLSCHFQINANRAIQIIFLFYFKIYFYSCFCAINGFSESELCVLFFLFVCFTIYQLRVGKWIMPYAKHWCWW